MKKYLLVGLGNPGVAYENTRHNIGFNALDALASDLSTVFSTERHAQMTQTTYKGKRIIMIKPITYMNLSGKAVAYWLFKENIPLEHLLVLVDDLALPFNKIRLKPKGSHGGHNGLRSISEVLQTNLYARLRIGIGNDFKPGQQSDFVLSKWNDAQLQVLPSLIERSTQASLAFIQMGVGETMNRFNEK